MTTATVAPLPRKSDSGPRPRRGADPILPPPDEGDESLVWAAAPPSETEEGTLIPAHGEPLVYADIVDAFAEANWVEGHCALGAAM